MKCVVKSKRIEFYDDVLIQAVYAQSKAARNNYKKDRCGTPQTCDTAYSSMKQSASPASLSPVDTVNYDVKTMKKFLDSVQNNNNEMTRLSLADIEEDVPMEEPSEPSMAISVVEFALPEIPFCPLIDRVKYLIDKNMKNVVFLDANLDEKELDHAIYNLWLCTQPNSTQNKAVKRKRNDSVSSSSSTTSTGSQMNRTLTSRQKSLKIIKVKQLEAQESMSQQQNLIKNIRTEDTSQTKVQREAERLKQIEEDLRGYNIKIHPRNYLLKALPKDMVCQHCLESGNVLKCQGQCGGFYHKHCLKTVNEDGIMDALKRKTMKISSKRMSKQLEPAETKTNTNNGKNMCERCSVNEAAALCSDCGKSDENCLKCKQENCNRSYHLPCLKYWPQHKVTLDTQRIICPRHVCHTCVSPHVGNLFRKAEDDKTLIKCILCSSTYHRASTCIPAGSALLSETQLICSRHHNKKQHYNVDHCSICSKSGHLICCDTCPHSFHEACLTVPVGEQYICEECESGRRPLYGEIVWAKYGPSPWWPAITVPTPKIPENMYKHKKHPIEFCVFFFGTHNFGWTTQVIKNRIIQIYLLLFENQSLKGRNV